MDRKRKLAKKRKSAWISAYRIIKNAGFLPDTAPYYADNDDNDVEGDVNVEDERNYTTDFVRPVESRTDMIPLQQHGYKEGAVEFASLDTSASSSTAVCMEESDWVEDNFEPYSSSDSECGSNTVDDSTLSRKLADWVNNFGIRHNAVDKLLCLLQSAGHKLPSSARTLLKTPKDVVTSQKSGGEYIYLDICKQLRKVVMQLSECTLQNLEELEVSLNVDGIPLFKSSSTSLWPILCAIVNITPVHVFPVAIFCGSTKPSDLLFLTDTVKDLSTLFQCGLEVGSKKFSVRLRCIVCDAPAKAMVKAVKMYSGYEGCDKCTQIGKWLGRMTFPEVCDLDLRTDDSFRQQCHPNHHHDTSPFCDLPIDMISTFPIDYMHAACLGVTRKLLLAWLRGKACVKISAGNANEISSRLLALRKCIPKLFARKPRSLLEIDRWKATEFRLFLLYVGKIVLKGILRDDLYTHFLELSVAMSIAVSPSLIKTHHEYAHHLLLHFVDKCHELYGHEFLVYNIHSMVHIIRDAEQFGCLDNCSGFIFENYLQKLKKMVRSGKNPVAQVVKRLGEFSENRFTENRRVLELSDKCPNNAYIINESTCCEVIETSDQAHVLCRVYHKTEPFFIHPCDSRIIGTYRVNVNEASIKYVERDKLKKLAIKVKLENALCFMAVLHFE